jgi:polyisoprenoid-binding protein YceI
MSWQIDSNNSRIQFTVRKLKMVTVYKQFITFEGTLGIDDTDYTRSRVEVRIAADNVNVCNKQRDTHLRKPEFLDVQRYLPLYFRTREGFIYFTG